MNKLLASLALVAVTAAAYTLSGEHVAAGSEAAPLRSISVTGEANRKFVPDEAHLRVNLNAMKMKLADAKAAHDEKLKKLMGIVEEAGIEARKVRTESSMVQPIYEYVNVPQGNSNRVFKGYRVQTQLDITVVDSAKVGSLMESITSAGFEQDANTEWGGLLNLQYEVSEREKKRDELLAEAIANAKQKAERMASAAGAGIGAVYQINEGAVSSFAPPMVPMPMMAMAKGAAMDTAEAAYAPPAGEQQLSATVSVVFELD